MTAPLDLDAIEVRANKLNVFTGVTWDDLFASAEDVPALVDRVRELEAKNKELSKWIEVIAEEMKRADLAKPARKGEEG